MIATHIGAITRERRLKNINSNINIARPAKGAEVDQAGIYTNWLAVSDKVTSVPGAQHHKAQTLKAAGKALAEVGIENPSVFHDGKKYELEEFAKNEDMLMNQSSAVQEEAQENGPFSIDSEFRAFMANENDDVNENDDDIISDCDTESDFLEALEQFETNGLESEDSDKEAVADVTVLHLEDYKTSKTPCVKHSDNGSIINVTTNASSAVLAKL